HLRADADGERIRSELRGEALTGDQIERGTARTGEDLDDRDGGAARARLTAGVGRRAHDDRRGPHFARELDADAGRLVRVVDLAPDGCAEAIETGRLAVGDEGIVEGARSTAGVGRCGIERRDLRDSTRRRAVAVAVTARVLRGRRATVVHAARF